MGAAAIAMSIYKTALAKSDLEEKDKRHTGRGIVGSYYRLGKHVNDIEGSLTMAARNVRVFGRC